MSKPNLLQTVLSVGACKLTRWGLRITGKGGTALPGKVARFFAPDILERVSDGMEIIVVTGTNGKTTTCRMLEHTLTSNGHPCLANKSGANLLSGVTAEITCNATWTGKPKTHYAVIECDEGALKQVVPLIHPKVIVVTNLFRDQLDRYGEVMHTVETIRVGIKKVPESILCLNADDSLVSSLAFDVPNKVVYYGIDVPVGDQSDERISDARHCIRCGAEYRYHYHTYAHLGGFYCPKCGYARQTPEVSVRAIREVRADGSDVQMQIGGEEMDVHIGLPAVYNIYNAAAAICGYRAFGLPVDEVLTALSDVHSSFGRMENFQLGGVRVQMILVKNPAGCNQALSYLAGLSEDFNAVFCLNDHTADGHDISWIWDADYETVVRDPHLKNVFVWGERAEDMQLRLKYAGLDESRVTLFRESGELIEAMKKSALPVFVLPNYTTMLALRAALGSETGAQDFWKG